MGVLIVLLDFFQTSTNAQFSTAAVLTRVTTLLAHSPVPVQVVSSWILGNEVAKVKLLSISNKLQSGFRAFGIVKVREKKSYLRCVIGPFYANQSI